MTLYEISEELEFLDQILEENHGELDDKTIEHLNRINALLESKVDSICEYISKQKDLVNIAKSKIDRLKKFIEVQNNKIERFERYIMMIIEKSDRRFVGEINEIRIRKPSKIVVITDESKIPANYIQIEETVKINKKDIMRDLRNDNEVPGATLGNGKKSLIFDLRKN